MQPEPYPDVTNDEILSRVITRSGDFARTKGRVKAGAFKTNSQGISIMRIEGLSEEKIRKLERDHIEKGDRTAKARAEITKSIIRSINSLDAIADTNGSYPRHASIIGLSIDSQQREMEATKLAENSRLEAY